MKSICYLLTCSIIVVSCHVPTPEEQASELAASFLKKQLFYPDSYEPIDCTVDTAYSPIDTPETIALLTSIADLVEKYQEQVMTVKTKERFYEMEKGSYQRMKSYGLADSYTEYQYKEAKNEYEEAQSKLDKQIEKLLILTQECQELEKKGKNPCGWKIAHSYKAKTNGGNITNNCVLILTDKDFSGVVSVIDEDQLSRLISIREMIQDNQ